MQQIPLDWAWQPDYSAPNYMPLTSQQNERELILSIPNKHHWGAVLTGPEGAGKTHLMHVWASQSCAQVVNAAGYTFEPAGNFIAVDNLSKADRASQTELFHLFNHLNTQPQRGLIIASNQPLEQLDLLTDLSSRLKTLAEVVLPLPSEPELKLLLAKWAADRQLELPPQVLNYLLTHTSRHPALLQGLLTEIDIHALSQKRKLTIPLVKEVLSKAGQAQ